jgi:hypothetical protein
VCVLERRELVGGACVIEEVWPGQRVSRASYVVSMLQPKVVRELELARFGYDPVPLDPPFATIRADGRPVTSAPDASIAAPMRSNSTCTPPYQTRRDPPHRSSRACSGCQPSFTRSPISQRSSARALAVFCSSATRRTPDSSSTITCVVVPT